MAAALAVLALAGCADTSRVDNPLLARFSWFQYLAGQDIKAACTSADAPARYRFVYNAVFDEQVRAYDLQRNEAGAELKSRVSGGDIRLLEFGFGSSWRPETLKRESTAQLDTATYLALIRQIEADGFGAAPQEGMRLQSYDFYWTVSACAGGRFHFNAWRNETPEFAALRFPALLFAQDKTDIAPAKPYAQTYAAHIDRVRNNFGRDQNFEMIVRDGGLFGTAPLLR
ncbi:MAG: hypothetical protein NBV67_05120 [Tagaea sp.]|nr:hypothetical protein [Tagaea sp.]